MPNPREDIITFAIPSSWAPSSIRNSRDDRCGRCLSVADKRSTDGRLTNLGWILGDVVVSTSPRYSCWSGDDRGDRVVSLIDVLTYDTDSFASTADGVTFVVATARSAN